MVDMPKFAFVAKIAAALTAGLFLTLPLLASAHKDPYPQQKPYPPQQQQYPPQQQQYPQQQQPYPQQQQPYPQQQGPTPSYALPPPGAVGDRGGVTGTVSAFDGQWIVYMHDDKGYTDHITLHQGTIINPTGIRLVEGMHIT